MIRLGFLQQNAFHKDDTCVSLGEAVQDDGCYSYLYKKSRHLVAMGMPMSVLKAEGIFERVIAIKYDVPNDNLQLLDSINWILMTFITASSRKMRKGRDVIWQLNILGLSSINGPLVVLEGVENAFYDEIVEFIVDRYEENGTYRGAV